MFRAFPYCLFGLIKPPYISNLIITHDLICFKTAIKSWFLIKELSILCKLRPLTCIQKPIVEKLNELHFWNLGIYLFGLAGKILKFVDLTWIDVCAKYGNQSFFLLFSNTHFWSYTGNALYHKQPSHSCRTGLARTHAL